MFVFKFSFAFLSRIKNLLLDFDGFWTIKINIRYKQDLTEDFLGILGLKKSIFFRDLFLVRQLIQKYLVWI